MTKGQIDDLFSWAVRDGSLTSDEIAEIKRLALLGLGRDELAEKVGRAVLEAVMAGNAGRLGTPSQTLDEMADEVDAAAYWLTTPGEVLRSIADALREENDHD
jgi:hypothetical protein